MKENMLLKLFLRLQAKEPVAPEDSGARSLGPGSAVCRGRLRTRLESPLGTAGFFLISESSWGSTKFCLLFIGPWF